MCPSQFIGPGKHDIEQQWNHKAGDGPSKQIITNIFRADCDKIAIGIAESACEFEDEDEESALMPHGKPIKSLVADRCTLDPNSFSY